MLKKTGSIVLLFLFACSASKPVIDNSVVLQSHQRPIKIFGVGYWNADYMILTLVDARSSYFTIKTMRNDKIKIGDIYLQ